MNYLNDTADSKNNEPEQINFGFPFEPYSIQNDFMNSLYQVLDENKIGIFESPTGTGKSLSLICGTLRWLQDYEKKQKERVEDILSGAARTGNDTKIPSDEPSWVDEFFEQKEAKDMITKVKEKEENKKAKRLRLQSARKAYKSNKRKRDDASTDIKDNQDDDKENISEEDVDKDIVLNEYQSDNEDRFIQESSDEEDIERQNSESEDTGIKIYYCSRTHSQLNQFIHEVQKTKYAEEIQAVSLASRQSFCINEEVQKLKSTSKINEKCLDLQKKSKEKKEKTEKDQQSQKRRKQQSRGCPFYNTRKFQEFKNHAIVDVQDIEQLVSLGKDLDTCPYYGSRYSIPQSQLIVLPYQTLLHKSTRESVGIKLKGNVVIIDEAHNLIETINSIHSIEIKVSQIVSSINELARYKDRYRKRLKAKNIFYIDQILFVLNALNDRIKGMQCSENEKVKSEMMTINNFIYESNIDNVNLFKIRRFCQRSMISKKLNGFIDKYHGSVSHENTENADNLFFSSQFYCMESFFEALTNSDKDGRILITKAGNTHDSSLKFLLLNPSVHFFEVLKECKSVVVAGGTMQPVSEFKDVLLHSTNISEERITEFSCGHVIPPQNLTVLSMEKGPSSVTLDFTYNNRQNAPLIDELGRLLCNVCTVTPGGVVCFFASYDYEEYVYSRWWSSGMLQKIQNRKKVFREPKKSTHCDKILQNYADTIKKSKAASSKISGALLLSVVGGKMSEGINFSDDLGRCIVMVGLPYPNLYSPELKEKMEYLNKTIGPCAGQEHYENICMKAVNQSIGRAIRHRNDYATILLLDQRYTQNNVVKKLPQWIRSQLHHQPRFGPGLGVISKFFVSKRQLSGSTS